MPAVDHNNAASHDNKVYVSVYALVKADGTMFPRSFIWEDGNSYNIDKVVDTRRAASLKAGGSGLRYTIRVRNRDTFMFYEEHCGVGRWYMIRKERY